MRYKYFLLGAILFKLLLVGAYHGFDLRYGDYGSVDWLSYWSVPRAVLLGKGFNNLAWLRETQVALGYTLIYDPGGHYYPVRLLWNLPPLILLLLPLATLPFTLSALLWIGLSTYLYCYVAVRYNQTLARPVPEWLVILFPLFFLPYFPAMYFGQIGPFAVACVILAWLAQRAGRSGLVGLLLVPLMLKPHLLFIAIGLLLLVAYRKRHWGTFAAFAGTVLALVALAFLMDPLWIAHWRAQGAPVAWQTYALLDMLVASLALPGWVQLSGIPVAVAIALWRYRRCTEITPRQLGEASILSVLFSPYIWHHDLTVLLPAALYILAALWCHPKLRLTIPLLAGVMRVAFALEGAYRERYLAFWILLGLLWWMAEKLLTDPAATPAAGEPVPTSARVDAL